MHQHIQISIEGKVLMIATQDKVIETIMMLSAIIALSVGLMAATGCDKAIEKPEPEPKILNMGECTQGYETCCVQECQKYCSSETMRYSKHHPNPPHCICWCDY